MWTVVRSSSATSISLSRSPASTTSLRHLKGAIEKDKPPESLLPSERDARKSTLEGCQKGCLGVHFLALGAGPMTDSCAIPSFRGLGEVSSVPIFEALSMSSFDELSLSTSTFAGRSTVDGVEEASWRQGDPGIGVPSDGTCMESMLASLSSAGLDPGGGPDASRPPLPSLLAPRDLNGVEVSGTYCFVSGSGATSGSAS
mmetsp:Transcript_51104/g.91783  ORF Transcript_51104/g.91783 Transcript_51104/m.91783 type:complete len:200 (+) Transcript_51104:292-891(+)